MLDAQQPDLVITATPAGTLKDEAYRANLEFLAHVIEKQKGGGAYYLHDNTPGGGLRKLPARRRILGNTRNIVVNKTRHFADEEAHARG